ncbi:MAG: MFS transporter [Betaproteobacteria bacterium]|nr:MAG: MFS transporter [Betaproteobacteria bacterium]
MLNLTPYKDLFRDRQLRRIVLSSILPRLPAGINGLAITMMVQTLYGSFGAGGTVAAAYLVALGIASPLIGRLVDQNGPRLVMWPCALMHTLATVALVVAAMYRLSPQWLMLFSFAAGLSFPPVSMTVRAMWRKSKLPDHTKQLGFALEGVIMETVFICGPLIISLFVLLKAPFAALLFSAVATLVGAALFSRSGALERWGDVETAPRHWLGPLRFSGVRRALVLSTLLGGTFGLQEMGMMAVSKAAGNEAAVGFLFAAYSLSSGVMGLLYGTRQFAWPLNRQMALGFLWIALFSAFLSLNTALLPFGALCFLCGLATGPLITMSSLQLGKLTPAQYSTEAFTWSMTLFMMALGAAFAVGGWMVESYGTASPMIGAAIASALASAMCFRVPEIYVAAEASAGE